jgi:hypothetical protein
VGKLDSRDFNFALNRRNKLIRGLASRHSTSNSGVDLVKAALMWHFELVVGKLRWREMRNLSRN